MHSGDPASDVTSAPRIEPLTRLATGGMAEICLARERGAAGLERFVVVKRLLPHLARDEEIVDMFLSEARFVARLVHPNVVQIHHLGEDEQGYFLVMEYVEGCTVREFGTALKRADRTLRPDVAICIIEQACRGAHAAHELTDADGQPLGLVHRDISPHNLMVGPGGNVKLLDFGIAKATAAAEATHTGSLKGKSGYMSPEQCCAQPLDRRSDIFALGIMAWELLTGARLYQRESEYASMNAIVLEDAPSILDAATQLPNPIAEVIAKALQRRPEARWQTADAMRRALIQAAELSGLRPSRDALVATVSDVLGERLQRREEALREAARKPPDPEALRAALLGPRPSQPSVHSNLGTGSHTSGTNDAVTVAQRRSGRAAPSANPTAGPPSSRLHIPALPPIPLIPTSVRTSANRPEQPSAPPPPSHPSAAPTSAPSLQTAAAPWEPPKAAATPWPSSPASPGRAKKGRWLVVGALTCALSVAAVLWFRGTHATSQADGKTAASVTASVTATGASAAPPLTGEPLRFAMPPTVEPQVIREEMTPFAHWLARQLGRPVEVVIADSYEHCGEMLASNTADIGLLPPLLFVQTTAQHPQLQPVALRLYDGARGSDGYLLVREDSAIANAPQLRGRTVCLVDKTSTTGFLLPRIWMRKSGINPDKDVTTVLSGDHLAVLRDLLADKCDAGAVYSGAYLSAQKQGIKVGRIRVLAITGRVPQDVFVASKEMPAELHAELTELMINFAPQRDIGAPRIGDVLGISGFATYQSSEFDPIRLAAKQEGLLRKR